MSNAISLCTYRRRRKKKGQPYIIPPSFFRTKGTLPIPKKTEGKEDIPKKEHLHTTENASTPPVSKTTSPIQEQQIAEAATKKPERKSILESRERKVSGLSLSSIKKKKEHEESKVEKVIDPTNLPKTAFTEAAMQAAWVEYGKMQDKKGERIVGSMFAMNIPTSKENKIQLELPNQSMKIDLESAQAGLLQFLYRKLDNYDISLEITVNEEASKKYAFTPQDKYDKLREKNPLLDKLRSSFDLDI